MHLRPQPSARHSASPSSHVPGTPSLFLEGRAVGPLARRPCPSRVVGELTFCGAQSSGRNLTPFHSWKGGGRRSWGTQCQGMGFKRITLRLGGLQEVGTEICSLVRCLFVQRLGDLSWQHLSRRKGNPREMGLETCPPSPTWPHKQISSKWADRWAERRRPGPDAESRQAPPPGEAAHVLTVRNSQKCLGGDLYMCTCTHLPVFCRLIYRVDISPIHIQPIILGLDQLILEFTENKNQEQK